MASDHRGNHVHAGKRTDDELMANPFYNAGDPLLQSAKMDRMQGGYPSMEKQAPVGKVPPMVTAEGVKKSAMNTATAGYAKATAAGAAVGAGLLGGAVSAGIGDQTYYDGATSAPKAAVLGAAIGAAGKFLNDTRKMPKSSRSQK